MLGEKIKSIRVKNSLTQMQLADILCVSEKTISSWENNRTMPDLNMIYKISDYFKKSFYYLIDDKYKDNINGIEIKIKVDSKEHNRLLDRIKSLAKYINTIKQNDTYYVVNNSNSSLRSRNENGKYIFSFKEKLKDSYYKKYNVILDNIVNLNIILSKIGVKEIGEIKKERIIYVYNNKYEFSFDNVDNIGLFVEIKILDLSDNTNNDMLELLSFMNKLNIDLNMIDKNNYVDYLERDII